MADQRPAIRRLRQIKALRLRARHPGREPEGRSVQPKYSNHAPDMPYGDPRMMSGQRKDHR